MEDLLKMVEGLIDLLSSIGTFVADWIKDVIYAGDLLFTIITKLPDIFGWLPVTISAGLFSLFTIVITFKILKL